MFKTWLTNWGPTFCNTTFQHLPRVLWLKGILLPSGNSPSYRKSRQFSQVRKEIIPGTTSHGELLNPKKNLGTSGLPLHLRAFACCKKGEINTKQTAWLLYSHTRTDPSSSGWSVETPVAHACWKRMASWRRWDVDEINDFGVLCFQTGSQHVFNFVELLSVVQIHRWLAQYAGSELMRKRWGRTWVFCAFSSDWWIIFSDLTGPSVWDWKSVAELSFEFR